VAYSQQPTPEITSAGGDADAGRGRGDAPGSKLRGPDDQGDVPGPGARHPHSRAAAVLLTTAAHSASGRSRRRRSRGVAEGKPAGRRRRGRDVAVAAGGVIGGEFFPKRRWLAAGSSFGMCQEAAGSSFGMCQEQVTVALSANGSNRPFPDIRPRA
jgi:hypothetical protein